MLTSLVDLLPQIDGLNDGTISRMRDAQFHADTPYLLVLVGPFSSGKSSLINALLGTPDLLPVGVTPTTDRITMLRYAEQRERARMGEVDHVFVPSPLLRDVSLVDTPGLESVFRGHEAQTRSFLHRSDAVLLVMLATQAMTSRNVEYLQLLREYDKRIIIALNQVDLLSEEERDTVRAYVAEQYRAEMGKDPDIWMLSARLGLQARQPDGTTDAALWRESGLHQLESFVQRELNDLMRLRQKLQTPLQIAQYAHDEALRALSANQQSLDHYQRITANLDQQLAVYERELHEMVRETQKAVQHQFEQVAARGERAIRAELALRNTPHTVGRGLVTLFGLGRLSRRSLAATVLEREQAFEPLAELEQVSAKLAPKLEGKDVHDVEDVVKYARRELDNLPGALRSKVIGEMQPPLNYDRTALQHAQRETATLIADGKQAIVAWLEAAFANSYLAFGAIFAICVIVLAFLVLANPDLADGTPIWLVLAGGTLLIALLTVVFMPLRGQFMATAFANRVAQLQNRYALTIREAADTQVQYGMRLRRDAANPLRRLIEAQTVLQKNQLEALQKARTDMIELERQIVALK